MEKVELGRITVDSGQILIADPCYIDSDWEKSVEGKGEFGGGTYEKCCKSTIDNPGGEILVSGIAGTGVASRTGLGDGVYPVVAIIKDNRVKELRIKFF